MSYFAEKHYPEIILPEELDAYLSRGWYRMGQTVFTTHFLCFDETLYSAIWVRLDLQQHGYSKSQRKLMTRNGQRFRVLVQPASITAAKEKLFRKYRTTFKGLLGGSLRDNLLDSEDYNVFYTMEVQVLDGDKLVALSYFDLGQESAASIMGIYDPDYAALSLGYYTMLLEMEYCRQVGLRYYYPGYVVPGYYRFDYKLRIGDVDYLDLKTGEWLPFKDLPVDAIPLNKMTLALRRLEALLQAGHIDARVYYYPFFEAGLFGFWNAPYLDYPVFLNIGLQNSAQQRHKLFAAFDVRSEQYHLLLCVPFDNYYHESYINAFDPRYYFLELMVIERVLGSGSTAYELAQLITSGPYKKPD